MSEPPRYEPEILHQLKNQLVVVVGFADLLVSELAADDPHRADVLQIQAAANAAISLVAELGGHRRD